MYSTLLTLHSLVRWLVLILILYSIYRALVGFIQNKAFSKIDNAFRHRTATMLHIQMMIGIVLYAQSPIVKYFWSDTKIGLSNLDLTFFGVIHIVLMIAAIGVLTTGSGLAKRKPTDKEKFRTILIWYSIALLIIFIAIPWPFSPLSNRNYLPTF